MTSLMSASRWATTSPWLIRILTALVSLTLSLALVKLAIRGSRRGCRWWSHAAAKARQCRLITTVRTLVRVVSGASELLWLLLRLWELERIPRHIYLTLALGLHSGRITL